MKLSKKIDKIFDTLSDFISTHDWYDNKLDTYSEKLIDDAEKLERQAESCNELITKQIEVIAKMDKENISLRNCYNCNYRLHNECRFILADMPFTYKQLESFKSCDNWELKNDRP